MTIYGAAIVIQEHVAFGFVHDNNVICEYLGSIGYKYGQFLGMKKILEYCLGNKVEQVVIYYLGRIVIRVLRGYSMMQRLTYDSRKVYYQIYDLIERIGLNNVSIFAMTYEQWTRNVKLRESLRQTLEMHTGMQISPKQIYRFYGRVKPMLWTR